MNSVSIQCKDGSIVTVNERGDISIGEALHFDTPIETNLDAVRAYVTLDCDTEGGILKGGE